MRNTVMFEKQLISRAKAGDKQAFGSLALQYQPKIQRLIHCYITEPAEVADITQEILIKVYRSLQHFRGDSRFYTWIYRITVNTTKTHLINTGHHPELNINIDDAQGYAVSRTVLQEIASPECELIVLETESALYQAIEALPDELSTTLMLRELEGLSYETIADVMECPVGTIRSRLFRARESILCAL